MIDKEEKTLSIQDMNERERPRERLERLGAGELNVGELMAILLRVGVQGKNAVQLGWELVHRFGGLNGLHEASFDELSDVRGVGRAKASQIKAAIELGHRMKLEEQLENPVIKNPASVHDLMAHEVASRKQEQLWVLALSTRNEVIRQQLLYIGTLNHSSVRLAEIFEVPIRCRAASVIIVHNHPSGNHSPSEEDVRFTEELIKAGNMLDIGVLDHIILARDGFSSIRQLGRVVFNTPQPKTWH
jgi:DNA repair protein RadC